MANAGDPYSFVPWLFDRLKSVAGIRWDEKTPPVHTSYGDWHVWGTRQLPTVTATTATSSSAATASSSSTRNSPRPTSRPPLPGRSSSSESLKNNDEPKTQPINAKISHNIVNIERQYQLSKAFLDELDPSGLRHVRTLELLRLPARNAGELPLCVCIMEDIGENHLRDMVSCGPVFYKATEPPQLHQWNPSVTASGRSKAGTCSISHFLDFAIGACECCELLHRENRAIHGELRPDSFHFDRDTTAVKLLNYGSGVQSFEHGLNSPALFREFGVEYKLQFISPEQTGRMPSTPDLRTDIYSLGIIFYYILTGTLPHQGQTPLEIMTSLLNRKVVSVSSKRVDAPDALSAVVQKMIQKNIANRYHSDAAIKHDLKQIQKFLTEGDMKSLEEFEIGLKDVNCFFTLPNIQIGRQEEEKKILTLIERVATDQTKSKRGKSDKVSAMSASSSNSSVTTGSRRGSSHVVDEVLSDGASARSRASPVAANGGHHESTGGGSQSTLHEDAALDETMSSSTRLSLEKRISIDRVSNPDFDFRSPSLSFAGSLVEGPKSILKDAQRFKRTRKCEIIAISGAAGLGKSTLVQSIQPTARSYGYFASAKFDQVNHTPFDGTLRVMSSLFRQIFSESDVNTEFHNNLRSFIRPVWKLLRSKAMLDLPEWLLGGSPASTSKTQSPEPRKGSASPVRRRSVKNEFSHGGINAAEFARTGSCAKNSRFVAIYLDVLRFISAHKFILFSLDDLQNADDESIDLLYSLIQAKIPIALILTFRDKSRLSPRALAIVNSNSALVTHIQLRPLNEDQVSELVGTALHRSKDYIFPLVAVIMERTSGNPFLVREMLEACHRQNCIWYSWLDAVWKFDLDKIFTALEEDQRGIQMNNDFILNRLRDLDVMSRLLLAWASLLGNSFSFPLVKGLMLKEHNQEVVASTQGHNSRVTLVRQSSQDAVRALHSCLGAYILEPAEDHNLFRFCHDRFLQSAASLPERKDTEEMHFRIAQLMLSEEYGTFSDFVTSIHIGKAIRVIKARVANRKAYREVLALAAESSIESGGRAAGLSYFANALALLQDNPWDDNADSDAFYEESLMLFTRAAECYWFQGQADVAKDLLQAVLDHAQSSIDKAPAWILQSRIFARSGNNAAAFKALKQCLNELGILIPDTTWEECDKEYYRILTRLGAETTDPASRQWKSDPTTAIMEAEAEHSSVTKLCSRAVSEDPAFETIGSVLCEIMGAAFWIDALLFYQIALCEFGLHLDRGVISSAGLAYVHLATVSIVRHGLVELGCMFGEKARLLFGRFEDNSFASGRGQTLFCMLIGWLMYPMSKIIPMLEDSLQASVSSGDRPAGVLNVAVLATAKLWTSQDVIEVENFCAYGAEELVNWENDARGGLFLVAIKQFCRALRGQTFIEASATVLTDSEHDTETYLAKISSGSSNPRRARSLYRTFQLPALVLFGYTEHAIQIGEELAQTLDQHWSLRFVVSNRFYLSLAYAASLHECPQHVSRDHRIRWIRKTQDLMLKWGTVNDSNLCTWSSLLDAVLAEIDARYPDCLQAFENALDHSEVLSLSFEQGLVSELYAEFMIRRGANRPARNMLYDSIAAYRRISAFAKASHVATKHEWLLRGTSSLHTADAACQTLALEDHHSPDITTAATGYTSSGPDNTHVEDGGVGPKALEALGLDVIDLTGILESSTVLSSELNIDKLLSKMTHIILESTSADLCAIVVKEENDWNVAAISDSNGHEYPCGDSLDSVDDVVGKQITLYTLRSSEVVFLNNIFEDERFSNVPESYRKRNPNGKAVISHPIVHGNNEAVLGCVYLEGPPHSFTERNVTVLRLLVNSISVSIKNATLFKRVEKVSASNAQMVESQKHALAQARDAEKKAKSAESEALRNVKLAEEAARAKSLFLANVSHELRTPLNGVIGMSELLKNTNLTSEQEEWCHSIRVCGDTLLQVINDILDFSKLEAGKMQIFAVPLSLTETIAEVVRALSYSNLDKDLKTITKLDLDKDMLVIGDPVRLHQILMNLLSNSYKFTTEGSVTVRAFVNYENEQEIQVTCSVEDTGLGISDEQKKKLFLPFSQADNSTARTHGGTGLGLSICKAIIERVMKGKIWLDSEEGKGTKVSFSLTFPKVVKGSGTSVASKDGENGGRSSRADPMSVFSPPNEKFTTSYDSDSINVGSIPRNQLRVCVAEDNPINQKIAISFVQKLGFKCEAFGDGKQAVEALESASVANNPFHVVLMDCQMPVLDGYDATRQIRRHNDPAVRGVLVIAMTASAIRGDRERCLEAGMNNYLAKPVRQQVLKQMLDGYLNDEPDAVGGLQDSPDMSKSVTLKKETSHPISPPPQLTSSADGKSGRKHSPKVERSNPMPSPPERTYSRGKSITPRNEKSNPMHQQQQDGKSSRGVTPKSEISDPFDSQQKN